MRSSDVVASSAASVHRTLPALQTMTAAPTHDHACDAERSRRERRACRFDRCARCVRASGASIAVRVQALLPLNDRGSARSLSLFFSSRDNIFTQQHLRYQIVTVTILVWSCSPQIAKTRLKNFTVFRTTGLVSRLAFRFFFFFCALLALSALLVVRRRRSFPARAHPLIVAPHTCAHALARSILPRERATTGRARRGRAPPRRLGGVVVVV